MQAICAAQSVLGKRWGAARFVAITQTCNLLPHLPHSCSWYRSVALYWALSKSGNLRHISSSDQPNSVPAIYVSTDDGSRHISPLLLGMINYLERQIPRVGFFQPVSGASFPTVQSGIDRHVELIRSAMNWKVPPESMVGVHVDEATKLIASGKTNELLDKVYNTYETYRTMHETVVIEGTDVGGTEFDALMAATLNAPVLLVVAGRSKMSANDYFSRAMLKRQVFLDHKVDVLGVVFNKVAIADHAIIVNQLKRKFAEVGVPFAGALPFDPLLSSVRLDEIRAAMGATLVHGLESHLDQEFDDVVIASQRVEELLEMLEEYAARHHRPLVITSEDRLDVVLALMAAQLSVQGATIAGVLCTQATDARKGRSYARAATARIIEGISRHGGAILPVMQVERPLYDVAKAISSIVPSILPTSAQKITQSKMLFDSNIDMNPIISSLHRPSTTPLRLTPKMFMHNIKKMCSAEPQHIVLPEGLDQRILGAASEVTRRGLARCTLLGDAAAVSAQAKKLGLDISLCNIRDPKNSEQFEKYVTALCEARKHKSLTREVASDMLSDDVNMFGTMMVVCGDADGMVSGAAHTTAATIRPALQVLRTPQNTLVSSVFFMCLPDKVLVYGDCAVNVSPSASELAQIAITSADTAAAFGIDPRVAMLSYSTLGSGAGPDVQKVTEAVALVKQSRPDLKVEGPIQYDAAVDPAVAAVKVKGQNDVAGKATVFVFPDLNTGNNTYKAVQQSTGAIAMGPIVQGLLKPVNDLSRGCTVPDVVNTICVTSILAMQARKKQAKQA